MRAKERRQQRKSEYGKRNTLLKKLGYANYDEYLKSPQWQKIRAAKLKREPNCYTCGETATQVHHGKYTFLNLTGHSLNSLFSTCANCHRKAEFRDGEKLSPTQATKYMKKARRKRIKFERKVLLAIRDDNVDTQFKERMERA